MDIEKLLEPAGNRLKESGIENWFMESRWLLAGVLKIRASILYASPELEITDQKLQQFEDWIGQRISGKPLAYIAKEAPFYELDFYVNESVLIPRPETEELVEYCLDQMPESGSMLDICCGSGCIGLSLLQECKQWSLTLSDISDTALEVCHSNVQRHHRNHPDVKVVASDLYGNIPTKEKFDLIVSNPPYIHPDEKSGMDVGVVEHEPSIALFHDDPVQIYAELLQGAKERLRPNGMFIAELSPRFASDVLASAQNIFQTASILKDMSNKERFIVVK